MNYSEPTVKDMNGIEMRLYFKGGYVVLKPFTPQEKYNLKDVE